MLPLELVEQTLVNMAGITSSQENAIFRSNKDETTYFKLFLDHKDSENLFDTLL